MNIALLVILFMFSILVLVLVSFNSKFFSTVLISVLVSLFLFSWIVVACNRPAKIDHEEILDYKEIIDPSNQQIAQTISFFGSRYKSEIITINLNKRFNVKLKENTKIKITHFSSGPFRVVLIVEFILMNILNLKL